jgi:hypothetical protein
MRRSSQDERVENVVDSDPVKTDGITSTDIELEQQSLLADSEPLLVEEINDPHRSLVTLALVLLVLLAFLVRLVAADRLTPWVDEPVSMLAAFEVAEDGVPVLPSGKLYLQGATLSYILAPVVLVGFDELGDIRILRLVSVLAGTAAVIALFFLTRDLTNSNLGGFLAGGLLALDPSSVRWSSYVRMYALLQLSAVLLIWLFLRLLLSSPSRRAAIALVGIFWFGVFSQIAIVLFWPAMALGAFWVYGRSLLNRRRDLTFALAACLGAPLAFVGLNRLVKPPGLDSEAASIDADFVGAHILSIHRFLHPTIDSWLLLFRGNGLITLLPIVIFGASCALVGRYFLGVSTGYSSRGRRRLLGAALLLYWTPIALVGTFSSLQQPRYLVHIQPLGYFLITLLVLDLAVGWRTPETARSFPRFRGFRQSRRGMVAATTGAPQAVPKSAEDIQTGEQRNGHL